MQAEQGSTGINPISSFLRGKKKAKSTLDVSTKQPSDDTRCSIPGCKQFVYVDEEGVRSDFCSLRHREYDVPSLSFFRGRLKYCFLFQRSSFVWSQNPMYHVLDATAE